MGGVGHSIACQDNERLSPPPPTRTRSAPPNVGGLRDFERLLWVAAMPSAQLFNRADSVTWASTPPWPPRGFQDLRSSLVTICHCQVQRRISICVRPIYWCASRQEFTNRLSFPIFRRRQKTFSLRRLPNARDGHQTHKYPYSTEQQSGSSHSAHVHLTATVTLCSPLHHKVQYDGAHISSTLGEASPLISAAVKRIQQHTTTGLENYEL